MLERQNSILHLGFSLSFQSVIYIIYPKHFFYWKALTILKVLLPIGFLDVRGHPAPYFLQILYHKVQHSCKETTRLNQTNMDPKRMNLSPELKTRKDQETPLLIF